MQRIRAINEQEQTPDSRRLIAEAEKRGERWGLAHRCVVHVKDRIDAVESQAALPIDTALLARQPAHYRHLAYIHAIAGRVVKTDMPGLEGPEADRLERQSRSWLDGSGAPAMP